MIERVVLKGRAASVSYLRLGHDHAWLPVDREHATAAQVIFDDGESLLLILSPDDPKADKSA